MLIILIFMCIFVQNLATSFVYIKFSQLLNLIILLQFSLPFNFLNIRIIQHLRQSLFSLYVETQVQGHPLSYCNEM